MEFLAKPCAKATECAVVSLGQILQHIAANSTKKAAEILCERFREGIESGWKDADKTAYQQYKAQHFSIFYPSLHSGKPQKGRTVKDGEHTGFVDIDLDECSRDVLEDFVDNYVHSVPYIMLTADSVSGRVSGDKWALIAIDLPRSYDALTDEFKAVLDKDTYIHELQELYWYAITDDLNSKYGLNITGSHGKSPLSGRYIGYDDDYYYNDAYTPFPLAGLTPYLKRYEAQKATMEAEVASKKDGEKSSIVQACIEVLKESGEGLFAEGGVWYPFMCACKYAHVDYEDVDTILSQSSGYNANHNLKRWTETNTSKHIGCQKPGIGTIAYYAKLADRKAYDTRVKPLIISSMNMKSKQMCKGKMTVSLPVRAATLEVYSKYKTEMLEDKDAAMDFLSSAKKEGVSFAEFKKHFRSAKETIWNNAKGNEKPFVHYAKTAKDRDAKLFKRTRKEFDGSKDDGEGNIGYADRMAKALSSRHKFAWNELEMSVYVDGKQYTDDIEEELYFEVVNDGFKSKSIMSASVVTLAKRNKYHPIKQYFKNLPNNGSGHIEKFCEHIKDSKGLFGTILRKWMIQAVNKAHTGAQNQVLVLLGDQEIGKSSLAAWLCPPELKDLYVECGQIDPNNKDHQLLHVTKFLGEVGELGSTTKKKEVRALKDYFTKQSFTVRQPYGKKSVKMQSSMSFIGTENPDGTGFLRDTTGNRRFLPVEIQAIDWEGYTKHCDIDSMWCEAYEAWKNGEETKLSDDDKAVLSDVIIEHTERTLELEYLVRYFEIIPEETEHKLYALEILAHMRANGYNEREGAAKYRISQELKRMGVEKSRRSRGILYTGIRMYEPYEVSNGGATKEDNAPF